MAITIGQTTGGYLAAKAFKKIAGMVPKKPLTYMTEGRRSRVYALGEKHVLKVPALYMEEVYDEDGIRVVSIREQKVDYKEFIKPGFDLACAKVPEYIPPMCEIQDFSFTDSTGRIFNEEWGVIQRRLPETLGQALIRLHNKSGRDLTGDKDFKYWCFIFVLHQSMLWSRGVWDYDMNFLDNYGITANGEIKQLDIDALSITNNADKYRYDPDFFSRHFQASMPGDKFRVGQLFYQAVGHRLTREWFEEIHKLTQELPVDLY